MGSPSDGSLCLSLHRCYQLLPYARGCGQNPSQRLTEGPAIIWAAERGDDLVGTLASSISATGTIANTR
jgi:hypothetical protein